MEWEKFGFDFFKAVVYVIRLTPYAIVALTADMVGSSTNLGSDFRSLVGLLVLVWGACFLHAYVLNGAILAAFADVPVVMLTAADSPLSRLKSKHAGISAYLTKPFVPDKVVVIAEKLIAERRLLRERK